MKLVLYQSSEVDSVWSELAPELARVVEKAVHGEFTLDDVYRLAKEGRVRLGAVRESGSLLMALAFEFVPYPSAMAVNVLAMAGRRMDRVMGRFLPLFREFCRKAGADWIECLVSPAMERMHRRHGFGTVYRCLRMDVKEG